MACYRERILTPWRGHFQGLASLIQCPEPLSFNYGSHSLTGRKDSSWGHHDMHKYTCMCVSAFHTICNFWTNYFSENLVEISQNVKGGTVTNKQSIHFILHCTLIASSTNQVTLRGWSRSGLWLFFHLFWMWHWCWILQKNKIWHKIPKFPFQITGEADHKSMCWLQTEELCKANKMDQSKLFKHSTVSTTLYSKFTNTSGLQDKN